MAEHINKEQLLSHLFSKQDEPLDVMKEIAEFPAAEVAEVRHEAWKLEMVGAYHDLKLYSCPQCGFSLPLNPTKIPLYCEDCGCCMDKEAEHEVS
jgi:predicted Zn-ribbon and HTH transcriptional regulator